jgi:hypothetical protein
MLASNKLLTNDILSHTSIGLEDFDSPCDLSIFEANPNFAGCIVGL